MSDGIDAISSFELDHGKLRLIASSRAGAIRIAIETQGEAHPHEVALYSDKAEAVLQALEDALYAAGIRSLDVPDHDLPDERVRAAAEKAGPLPCEDRQSRGEAGAASRAGVAADTPRARTRRARTWLGRGRQIVRPA